VLAGTCAAKCKSYILAKERWLQALGFERSTHLAKPRQVIHACISFHGSLRLVSAEAKHTLWSNLACEISRSQFGRCRIKVKQNIITQHDMRQFFSRHALANVTLNYFDVMLGA